MSSPDDPAAILWSHRPSIIVTGCWLAGVLIIQLLNAWHILSHRIAGEDHWLSTANNIFSVQGEGTIPAWFSGVMLWSAGLGAMVLAAIEPRRTGINRTLGWGILGAAFFYLSADEILGLHENLNATTEELLGVPKAATSPWIIFGVIFVVVIGLLSVPLLRSLNRTTSFTIILAGAVFVTGAIGVECVGETIHRSINNREGSKVYTLLFTLEEFLEMLGVVIFLHAIHLRMACLWKARIAQTPIGQA